MSKHLSFRNFLAKEEESFFSGMSKIGINKDDYKKMPQYSSFFSFGKDPVNFGSYSILDYKKNEDGKITHVLVKQINDPTVSSFKFDKNHPDGERNRDNKDQKFLVPIEDLEKLLTQGQNQQAPAPGGDMGMGLGGI